MAFIFAIGGFGDLFESTGTDAAGNSLWLETYDAVISVQLDLPIIGAINGLQMIVGTIVSASVLLAIKSSGSGNVSNQGIGIALFAAVFFTSAATARIQLENIISVFEGEVFGIASLTLDLLLVIQFILFVITYVQMTTGGQKSFE